MARTTYDIIGCGAVVQQLHLPVLRLLESLGEIKVRGCYDRSADAARQVGEALGAERWGTEPRPEEGDGTDVALVATPPGSHAEIARQYLGAGKSVFVEKPFTTTRADAEELVREADERGAVIAVNHFWRFYPSFGVVRRALAGRKFGQVLEVEATEGFRMGWAPASNYLTEDPFGGVLHDTGSHLLDAVLFSLGADRPDGRIAVCVEGVDKVPPAEPSHDCRASFVLGTDFEEDIQVKLNVSRLRPRARALKIRGSFGLMLVPATFARAPALFLDDQEMRLEATGADSASSVEDCFLRGHREFLEQVRGGQASRLSGSRFLGLTELLEDLWSAES